MWDGVLNYTFRNRFGQCVGSWSSDDTENREVTVRRYARDRLYDRTSSYHPDISFDEWVDKCLHATIIDPPTETTSESNRYTVTIEQLAARSGWLREAFADTPHPDETNT
jgi:hypothetical protein